MTDAARASAEETAQQKRSFAATFDTLVSTNLGLIKVVSQLVKLSYVLILIQTASLLYLAFGRK